MKCRAGIGIFLMLQLESLKRRSLLDSFTEDEEGDWEFHMHDLWREFDKEEMRVGKFGDGRRVYEGEVCRGRVDLREYPKLEAVKLRYNGKVVGAKDFVAVDVEGLKHLRSLMFEFSGIIVPLEMNSENVMGPTGTQPQSSQGRQQKRQRNQAQSHVMESQASDFATSSRHIEVGSASQEASQKPVYETWTEGTEAHLFEWLELPNNYEKWKGAGFRNASGSTRTSGLTKKAVTVIISEFLDTLHTKKTLEQVMSKMRYVEKKFREAEDYLRNTGAGLSSNDEKLGIATIREKVISICPFYFRVKPIMSESVAVNPPYIGETGTTENIQEMLFGTSIGQGLHESMFDEGDTSNSEEEDSRDDEEADFEEETCPVSQPIPNAPSQGTPIVPQRMQHRPTPNCHQQEHKKKPKAIGEAIADMQEQNRVLMEKKLEKHSRHQDEKLQFLREQSDKQFALEYCRLDLEVMRMDQQRQDSRIRELALQVELEKLRAKT